MRGLELDETGAACSLADGSARNATIIRASHKLDQRRSWISLHGALAMKAVRLHQISSYAFGFSAAIAFATYLDRHECHAPPHFHANKTHSRGFRLNGLSVAVVFVIFVVPAMTCT